MNYHQIINVLVFNKSKIFLPTVISVVFIFLVLNFIFPLTYNAEVSILPPEKNSEMGGLGALLGADGFSNMVTGGMGNANSQLFMEIIKSRNASLYVVEKFKLDKFYDVKNKIIAAKKLSGNLSIEVTKEGIIKLNVDVKTGFFPFLYKEEVESVRKLAASLSNGFVEALDKINQSKLSSKAKRARQYIETQLTSTKVKLDSVEQELTNFQKKNKTIALPEQLTAALETAAKLKAEIVTTEIQLGLMQYNAKEDNRAYVALKNKLDELSIQYSKIESGNNDFLLAFENVPDLGRLLARLMRDVRIQNEVYLLLQQQYYKEKIQENRDIPTIEVLDEAIPPLKASAPRPVFSSLLSGLFIFFILALIIVVKEKGIMELKSKKEN
ncbi:MAG: hypothetical protein GW789_09025 [Ignavibacteria bacterium]|nr:hypothetical protein [Ignavibacteria bacterium]